MPYKDKEYGKKRAAERHQERKNDQAYVKHRKEYAQKYHKEHWQIPEYRKQEKARMKRDRRKIWLKYRYGLTEIDFLELWTKQSGICPICNEKLLETNNTCVDHGHKTDKVRGLVHKKCNTAIGYIEAFRDKLRIIFLYLEGT
jgi:hypothetical protein